MTRRTGPMRLPHPTRGRALRLPRRVAAALLAVGATVSLSACDPSQVGAAAIVDGKSISVEQLQDATTGFLAVAPQVDAREAQGRILERMILSRVIAETAAEEGVSTTAGEVASQHQQIADSVGGDKALVQALAQQQPPTVLAPSYVEQWTRDRVLFSKLAAKLAAGSDPGSQQAGMAVSDALVETSKKMDIDVNPRYGTWDSSRGLQPELSGGLSKTVDELTSPTPAQ